MGHRQDFVKRAGLVGAPLPIADGVTQQVKVRVKTPLPGLKKAFLRLRVIKN